MSKILGYLVSLVGILLLAYTLVTPLKNAIPIPVLKSLSFTVGAIISLVIIVVGIVLVLKGNTPSEIPIYEGDKIVGYRKQ